MSLCGRNAVQIHEKKRPLDLVALAARLAGLGTVRANEFALRFDDGEHEVTVFRTGAPSLRGLRTRVWREVFIRDIWGIKTGPLER